MKNSLHVMILIGGLFMSNIMHAQPVTLSKAILVAKNHWAAIEGSQMKKAISGAGKSEVISVISKTGSRDTLMYILNDTISRKFVIVAADEGIWPIIGYSLTGSYNQNNQPPAFIEWIENTRKEIEYIKYNHIKPESKINQEWERMTSLTYKSVETSNSVEPLLSTRWNQDCYFNEQCPGDVKGPCNHALTGCVATSMAQIMKYWNFPTNGSEVNNYTHPVYGNLSADFGATTYAWEQMPDTVKSSNNAIATLMYHCGVSVNMDYGPDASNASEPLYALVNHFKYSPGAELALKFSYSDVEWNNLLKAELDMNHPVWYRGNSAVNGHAWVCDGYQGSDYFHFNWGWGGSQDGYFYLGSTNYNTDQAAIIKLVPSTLPDGYKGFYLTEKSLIMGVGGGSISADISSSVNWTAISDQSWLTVVNPVGLPGTSKISLAAEQNSTNSKRIATITVSAPGFNDQFFTVVQDKAYYSSVHIDQPGTLHELLGDKLSMVTRLTVSGNIDACDFKTMRDEMPLLAELDLNDATIVEYTGTGGTSGITPILKTYPANSIPNIAFYYNSSASGKTSLTKVTLPKTITLIEPGAFMGCKGLVSISIPDYVTTIGGLAFFDCSGMNSIYIPASVFTVGSQAFSASSAMITVAENNPYYSSHDGVFFDKQKVILYHCPRSKKGSYSIPNTVETIDRGAFEGCNELTSVNIPNSVRTIGEAAFYYCLGLASIEIPSSVTTIKDQAFWYNSALLHVDPQNQYYASYEGSLFNKDLTKIIQCSWAKSTFNIPSTVTEIGAHAFENCTKLINVSIPSSVSIIGEHAFWSTCNLSALDIPSSVVSIGQHAFHALGTYSHGIVKISSSNPNYSSLDGVVFNKDKTSLIMCPDFFTGTYKIPSTVTRIGNGAFLYCQLLTLVNISSSVNIIEAEAFLGCSGLKAIAVQSKIPVLLSNDYYAGAYKVFNGINKTECILYVPYGTKDLYSNSSQWKDFINIKEASEGFVLRKYSDYVNSGEGSISSIELKANVAWTATSDQSWLKVSPGSGTSDAVLQLTASLNTTSSIRIAKVIISSEGYESDTIIITQAAKTNITAGGLHDTYASTLNSLTSLELSGTIDARDFKTMRDEMPVLSKIDLSDVTIISYTGSGGTNFNGNSIYYPANTIPDYAFTNASWQGKNTLTNVILPESLTAVGSYAFRWCTGLQNLIFPPSVNSIGRESFSLCYGLNTITIPATVNSIATATFNECTNLNSIFAFPSSPVDLSKSALVFSNVNKSKCKLYVPQGSAVLYASANQWKDFVSIIEIPGFLLPADSINLSPAECKQIVDVISYTSWSVSSDQPWLKVETINHQGINSFSITATANYASSDRIAIVTVSSPGFSLKNIIVTQYASLVGLDGQPDASRRFKCFPNPSTGIFYLSGNEAVGNIKIFNSEGKLVYTGSAGLTETGYMFDLSGYNKGIYTMLIITANRRETVKLVVL